MPIAPTATTELISDWTLVQEYLDNRRFIDPGLFNDLRRRGLIWVVNDLGSYDAPTAKATAYGRLLKAKRVFGEEEIDQIAHHIEAIKRLQQQLAQTEPGDAGRLLDLCGQLSSHAQEAAAYFRGK